MEFSGDNPLLQVTKRRGRPRKDPNQPKTKPPPIAAETLTPKPKRNIRVPERYGSDYSDLSIKLELEETDPVPVVELDPFLMSGSGKSDIVRAAGNAKPRVELNTQDPIRTARNMGPFSLTPNNVSF